MKKKVIAIAGFKGGVGKSTLSNFLAEKLGKHSMIVNLDGYQDAEDFNSSPTKNMVKDDSLTDFIKSKSSNFIVIDAGGFDDSRLYDVPLDLLILPTRTDYRSIKTTVDSAFTILHKIPDTPVLFVLNMYQTEKELSTAISILEDILMMSAIEIADLHVFAIKNSAAVITATNKKMSLKELDESNRVAYKSVNEQFEQFKNEVLEIIGG